MKQSTKIGLAAAVATASLGAAVFTGVGSASGGSAGSAANGASPHWEYQGEEGPLHWGEIDESYRTCADGSAQTPINIIKYQPKDLRNIHFDYHEGLGSVLNNGHTVVVNSNPGNSIRLNRKTYPFAQVHFHTPSEHEINGVHYPVEVHFVHKTDANELAVVGVFIAPGRRDNPAWDGFVEALEADDNATVEMNWEAMLPSNRQTMRYAGSLTTPPCTEGVAWNVFTTPVRLSRRQINEFVNTYNGNMRPVQPLHGRTVFLDSTAGH